MIKYINYKGFTICVGKNGRCVILNRKGQFARNCQSIAEAKGRINNQEV